MKKVIGLILTLALTAGMLAGCGNGNGNNDEESTDISENVSGGVLTHQEKRSRKYQEKRRSLSGSRSRWTIHNMQNG